ncbi:GspE/PulE/PilB domain-containing protein, partial [Roseateles sp. GG27B]
MSAKPSLPSAVIAPKSEGRLEWRALLRWMLEDGLIDEDQLLRTEVRFAAGSSALHPLVRLGHAGLLRVSNGRALDLDALTEWLAVRAKLPYLRIDPLKVDVGRVSDVMSVAYAEAKRCLPVLVGLNEVTIATSEPFDTAWVAQIESHMRKPIKLVVANPLEI